MDQPTPSLAQGKTPEPERRRSFFSTLEVSFFDTGVAIETGEVSLPDELPREPSSTWRRWVLRRAGLVAGGACGLLLMVAFWVSAGTDPATPPVTNQRPAIMVPIEDSSPVVPAPPQARPRAGDASRAGKGRTPRGIATPLTGPSGGQDTRR